MNTKEYQAKSNDIQKISYKCPRCKANVVIPVFKEDTICWHCGKKVEKKGLKNVYELALINRLKSYWKRRGEE